jgi:hypothetical protein
MTTQPMTMERRLALLLADGSGDFDFIDLHAAGGTLWLEGEVRTYALERKAVELAEKVGFTRVLNRIRVIPPAGQGPLTRSDSTGGSQVRP